MDLEVIDNISANGTFDPDTPYHIHRNHHVDTLITIFGLGSIVASILIVFIMRRYEVLHTRPNAYVVNLCLSNILYLIFSPMSLNLFNIADIVQAREVCIVDESLMLLLLSLFAFASVLVLDWYIITYKAYKVSNQCKTRYALISTSIWIIILTFFITICMQCTVGISVFPIITVVAMLFYLYFFFLVFFIHIFRFCRHSNSNEDCGLELSIGTLFCLCWLPNLSLQLAYFYSVDYWFDFMYFSYCIAHTFPTNLFALLYYKDRMFRVCCRNMFKNEALETDQVGTNIDRRGVKQQFTLFT